MRNLLSHFLDNKQKYLLCIDDDPGILESLYTHLSDHFGSAYQIETAESGSEAFDIVDDIVKENGRVELVICDQMMPNLLGQYVLERLHQRDARMMTVLLTGQAGLDAVTYAINHAGLHKYIEKPWNKYDLLLTVESLLKQYQMSIALDIERKRYEMILDSMNNGVISLDFHGQIISFNHAAASILGIAPDGALGRTYFEIFFEYAGNEALNDIILRCINENRSAAYQEVEFLKKNGKKVPFGLMISLLQDVDGAELGLLMVFHDLSEIRRYFSLKDTFSRYVTKQVVEKISASGEEILLRGEKREISILFADIRGFTQMTERLEPTEVVTILNAYFSCVIDVIYEHEGTLDKFLGDGIMCLFGAPIDQPDHAIRAARVAIGMKQALQEFNQRQRDAGQQTLQVGIGINTGDAVVGNVGSEKRLEYTAIGDNVNLAARLQSIAKGGQILISDSVYRAIRDTASVKKLPPVKLKGKEQDVQVYELSDIQT